MLEFCIKVFKSLLYLNIIIPTLFMSMPQSIRLSICPRWQKYSVFENYDHFSVFQWKFCLYVRFSKNFPRKFLENLIHKYTSFKTSVCPSNCPSCYLLLNHWAEFNQTCYIPCGKGVQEQYHFSVCLSGFYQFIYPHIQMGSLVAKNYGHINVF